MFATLNPESIALLLTLCARSRDLADVGSRIEVKLCQIADFTFYIYFPLNSRNEMVKF